MNLLRFFGLCSYRDFAWMRRDRDYYRDGMYAVNDHLEQVFDITNLLDRELKKAKLKLANVEGCNSGLSQEDISWLINLCHPDKHGGKPIAQEMTTKLLNMRRR